METLQITGKKAILHRPVDLEIQAPSETTGIFTHRGGFGT